MRRLQRNTGGNREGQPVEQAGGDAEEGGLQAARRTVLHSKNDTAVTLHVIHCSDKGQSMACTQISLVPFSPECDVTVPVQVVRPPSVSA
jgi:hypothetical protein